MVSVGLGVAGCAPAGSAGGAIGAGAGSAVPVAEMSVPAHFTAGQAEAGARAFSESCSVCHSLTEFRGPIFAATWGRRPLSDFYDQIRTAMPEDAPGSLAPESYLVITAYLLRESGREAGEVALPLEIERLRQLRW